MLSLVLVYMPPSKIPALLSSHSRYARESNPPARKYLPSIRLLNAL